MQKSFSYLEITGAASAYGLSGSNWFDFAPDGILEISRTDSERAFDAFFEWKESGCFTSITMEHVTYSYGADQDPYEIPLRMAQSVDRDVVAEYIEGGMGVYM